MSCRDTTPTLRRRLSAAKETDDVFGIIDLVGEQLDGSVFQLGVYGNTVV